MNKPLGVKKPATPVKILEQWANGLLGASSQFSSSDNSARQLLGKQSVYPRSGSNTRAWSPVPRPGYSQEWVRLLFRQPVWAQTVVVYQTFNPGSLIEVRGAPEPLGDQGESSEWVTLWRGERYNTDPNRMPCDALELKCDPGAASQSGVRVIELIVDTTGWSEDFWSEFDAVKLIGTPALADSNAAVEVLPRPYVTQQLSETPRAFKERLAYLQKRFGPAPRDDVEAMRQAALSMVWANFRKLGCRYPAQVEEMAGIKGPVAASGAAIVGEMRVRGVA